MSRYIVKGVPFRTKGAVNVEDCTTSEEVIKKAYLLASKLHEGQFRKSGEPYITHPLHVAYILACTYNDVDTIIAGFYMILLRILILL